MAKGTKSDIMFTDTNGVEEYGDNIIPMRAAGANDVTPARRCSECGNYAMIKKDGCDFCTACGAQGGCG
jgi:ribonucleoside-diphosphate reductase alpha chain